MCWWTPKTPTLDPLENFRVDRRLRRLPDVEKSIGKCLKIALKIIAKSMKKSMKKRVDFWMDLLLDFGKVFGRVLGAILALKINAKSIQKLNKILIAFLMGFWAKMPPKWEARGTPKSTYFVDISRSCPRDPSGEANWTKMESKWTQNDAKIVQNWCKMAFKIKENGNHC